MISKNQKCQKCSSAIENKWNKYQWISCRTDGRNFFIAKARLEQTIGDRRKSSQHLDPAIVALRKRGHSIARINNRTLCRVIKVHVIHESVRKAAIIKTPFTWIALDTCRYYYVIQNTFVFLFLFVIFLNCRFLLRAQFAAAKVGQKNPIILISWRSKKILNINFLNFN